MDTQVKHYKFEVTADCKSYRTVIDGIEIEYISCTNSLCPSSINPDLNMRCFWEGELEIELYVDNQHIFLKNTDKKNNKYSYIKIGDKKYVIFGTGFKTENKKLYLLASQIQVSVYKVGQSIKIEHVFSASTGATPKLKFDKNLKQFETETINPSDVPGDATTRIYKFKAKHPGLYLIETKNERPWDKESVDAPWNEYYVLVK